MFDRSDKWSGSAESVSYRPGAGVYLALLVIFAAGVLAAGFVFWYVPTIGLRNIHPVLPVVFGAVLAATGGVLVAGASFMTIALVKGRMPFYSKTLHWLLVKVYLPILIMAGGMLRIPKIKIEQAFIGLNNQMVRLMGRKCHPEKILVLMPHCIQFDDCRIKVTRNVRNCAGCGKCEIGELLGLVDEFGVDLFISTGGTVARRKLYEKRPDAVVAVACERDLTSGVQDAYPLPVLAIVNKRPRGYCLETGVAVEEVRDAISELVGRTAA